MSNKTPVSAKTVRTYLLARPELWAGDAVIERNLKGRGLLNPATLDLYNKATSRKKVYVKGLRDNKRVTIVGKRGKKHTFTTDELRALDGSTGKRGRISDATKARALAELV